VLFLLSFVAAYFRAFLCRTLNMGQALHFSPVLLHSLTHSTRAKREREKEKKKERLNKKNVQLRFISVAIREGGS